MKGYKVSTLDGLRIGVAASSLEELIRKSCCKLKISEEGVTFALTDGTLIDHDFFATIDNQSHVILLKPNQTIRSSCLVNLVCSLLKQWRGDDLRSGLNDLIRHIGVDVSPIDSKTDQNAVSSGTATGSASSAASDDELIDRSKFSRRTEDPQWFRDLDTIAQTKEQYMRIRCAARVRTFFYRSRQQLRQRCVSQRQRFLVERILRCLHRRLRSNNAHAHYFDRSADHDECMCNCAGVFGCAGAVGRAGDGDNGGDGCPYGPKHSINPYANRLSRIEFSTWNLDHRIERSRTVLPALLHAVSSVSEESVQRQACSSRRVNCDYFYRLLFTAYNISLVHVVCHNKRAHSRHSCDPRLLLLPVKRQRVSGGNKQNSDGHSICVCSEHC